MTRKIDNQQLRSNIIHIFVGACPIKERALSVNETFSYEHILVGIRLLCTFQLSLRIMTFGVL